MSILAQPCLNVFFTRVTYQKVLDNLANWVVHFLLMEAFTCVCHPGLLSVCGLHISRFSLALCLTLFTVSLLSIKGKGHLKREDWASLVYLLINIDPPLSESCLIACLHQTYIMHTDHKTWTYSKHKYNKNETLSYLCHILGHLMKHSHSTENSVYWSLVNSLKECIYFIKFESQ